MEMDAPKFTRTLTHEKEVGMDFIALLACILASDDFLLSFFEVSITQTRYFLLSCNISRERKPPFTRTT